MKYLLDTNICIYLIKQRPPEVLTRLRKQSPIDIFISSITAAELYFGAEYSMHKERNRLALEEFLLPFEILPFDEKAVLQYGIVRTELQKKGKIIGAMDLMIAAHALANNLTLVTNNEREFTRVSNLKIENWTKTV
jgi:tRNA(fMet)-specific endonuclease VapC